MSFQPDWFTPEDLEALTTKLQRDPQDVANDSSPVAKSPSRSPRSSLLLPSTVTVASTRMGAVVPTASPSPSSSSTRNAHGNSSGSGSGSPAPSRTSLGGDGTSSGAVQVVPSPPSSAAPSTPTTPTPQRQSPGLGTAKPPTPGRATRRKRQLPELQQGMRRAQSLSFLPSMGGGGGLGTSRSKRRLPDPGQGKLIQDVTARLDEESKQRLQVIAELRREKKKLWQVEDKLTEVQKQLVDETRRANDIHKQVSSFLSIVQAFKPWQPLIILQPLASMFHNLETMMTCLAQFPF
eukprot:m.32842 g.32842  ORF g.32842 m.32842 type:complete len:293 (+) comp9553_c0_seq4:405-1283(+)